MVMLRLLLASLVASLVGVLPAEAAPVVSVAKLIRSGKLRRAIALLEGASDRTAAQDYQLARARALLRRTSPCDAMFSTVLEPLRRSLERQPRLRKRARRDIAFQMFRRTCVFQTLVLRPRRKVDRRQVLRNVSWQGTNWGTTQPGPTDSLSFSNKRVQLSAQRVKGGCPIDGRYRVKGKRVTIEGTCRRFGRREPVKLELEFDVQRCVLDLSGQQLFSDVPDECNV